MNYGAIYCDSLKKLQSRIGLEADEATGLLEGIFEQQLNEVQVATLLMALAAKGESIQEIIGFARGMRRYAVRLPHSYEDLVDTAGTGGDGAGTFNISTAAALVIAGAGVPVAKHGNRASSGRCGSADVLLELGVRIDAPREVVEECLRSCGIAFLFAPAFHPAMKIVARVRKEMGIRTIFNLLGPLLNPAAVRRQIIGVYSPGLTEVFAEVLKELGCQQALIFCGEDGLDEISLSGRTRVSELREGAIRTFSLNPEDLGIQRRPKEELRGGDVRENGRILRNVLAGRQNGAQQDVVLLNAAAGIHVSGKVDSLEKGLEWARKALESGHAQQKLEQLIVCSNQTTQ